jgi:hypothetical protein
MNNSAIAWKFLELTEVNRNYKMLPVKKISYQQQKPFIEVVDEILVVSNVQDYREKPQIQAKSKVLEQKINQMHYQPYGLSTEKYRIVERKKF